MHPTEDKRIVPSFIVLLAFALLTAAAPAAAAPGTVTVNLYYPNTSEFFDFNGTNGTSETFSLPVGVDAYNQGWRSFRVTVELHYEILDPAANFAPAVGWSYSGAPSSLSLTVPPRSSAHTFFNVSLLVDIRTNTTLNPHFHTYYSATGDAPNVQPAQEQETSAWIRVHVNGTAGGGAGSSGAATGRAGEVPWVTVAAVAVGGGFAAMWFVVRRGGPDRPLGSSSTMAKARALKARMRNLSRRSG